MKQINIGLMGLGTVGTGVVKLIEGNQEDLRRKVGCDLVIQKILVKNKHKQRDVQVDEKILTDDPADIIDNPDIDIVVEVMGGIEESKGHIIRALENGKQVVTANKDLMATHGSQILSTAAKHGCDVLYEASVAGGVPILRTIIDGFSSDRISKMMGIVNGTTNYILSKMSQEGASYEDVLEEAKSLGYAEADPTSDVEGMDAAYKMAILGTLGFQMNVTIDDVDVKGITDVSKEDIEYAKKLGYEMKLLGIAERQDDQISLSVEPTLVHFEHPLASVHGVFNAVYVYGEAVGETMFYGPGAGELPTAMSVVADIAAVAKNIRLEISGKSLQLPYKEKKLRSDEMTSARYFLLLHVSDKAGVLAKITEVFAKHQISLESLLQQPNSDQQPMAEITIITHHASKASMRAVQEELKKLDVVSKIRSVYRVEA